MKTLILVFLLFPVTIIAQVIGEVSIGTYYDKDKEQLQGQYIVFNTNTITCLFQVKEDTFNQLELIERIIKVDATTGNEKIYSSHTIDVDPEWNRIWGDIYLPKGNYKIKYYSKAGKFLGESFIFFITD